MENNKLPDDLLKDVEEIKAALSTAGRFRLLDSINTLCNMAESRIVIEADLDESKEAMTPLGGTIVEIQTVIVNIGQDGCDTKMGA